MTGATPIDYSLLDPNIRRLVRWLRSRGYETEDAFGGIDPLQKHPDLDMPNVFIVSTREAMCAHAEALLADLATIGIHIPACAAIEDGPIIQATFDPVDGSANLVLIGLTDADMPPPAN